MVPDAGMFLWMKLLDVKDSSRLIEEEAVKQKVRKRLYSCITLTFKSIPTTTSCGVTLNNHAGAHGAWRVIHPWRHRVTLRASSVFSGNPREH